MTVEKSPYEGTFDSLNGKTALGRVVDVDPINRRCRVKTIGQQGPKGISRGVGLGTDDHDIPDVQWITTASSDAGAEDTSIPFVGQIGVLIYINHEPYLVGFFRTLQPAPQDVPSTETTNPLSALITQGDRLISTIGGNYVILRSGASIEVVSTALCRTYWLPTTNLITSVCGDNELTTDGGFQNWTRDQTTDATLFERLAWDNLTPTNATYTQEGTSDSGAIFRKTAGALDENNEISEPTYDHQIDPTGKESKIIALTKYTQVGDSGSAYTTTMDTETEQASFSTPSGHTVVFDDSDGDGSITVIHKTGASIQITGEGAINFQTKDGNTTSFDSGVMTLTSANGGTVSVSDQITISDSSGSQLLQVTNDGITISAGKPITLQAPSVSINASNVAFGNSTTELLSLLSNIFTTLGTVQVVTAVGPSGPLTASPEWAALEPYFTQLTQLTGSV